MSFKNINVVLTGNSTSLSATLDKAAKDVGKFNKEVDATAASAERFKQTSKIVGAAGLAMGVGIAAGAAIAVKAAVSYESAFAGVKKTIDTAGMSAKEASKMFEEMSNGIREMSTRMPASANEIAGVAEAAGQLGIARDDVLAFSETMIKLGATTNLSADEAATSMARIANIMQIPTDDIDNLGAALVQLGNNGASTEADILQMATRIASAGAQLKMSGAEVLGWANALSSVGIEAEAGGSSISRVMIDVRNAVKDGTTDVEIFARTAGMSAAQFKDAFEKDASGAVASFIVGLGKMEAAGQNSNTVLTDLGLTDIRVGNALRSLAAAGDLLTDSLDTGKDAFKENRALAEEYGKRMETTEAQMEILKNQVVDVAITFGTDLLPALNTAVDGLGNVVGVVDDVLSALGPMGPVLILLSGAVMALGGGFLLLAPRIAATKLALETLNVSLPISAGAMGILGKAALGVGAAFVALQGLDQWAKSSASNVPGIKALTSSLLDFNKTGKVTGELARITGNNFEDLGKKIKVAGNSPFSLFDGAGIREVQEANKQIDALDKSLAELFAKDPKQAAKLFEEITSQAKEQGVSMDTVRKRFNDYGEAVAGAATDQKLAATSSGQLAIGLDGVMKSAEQAKEELEAMLGAIESYLGYLFSLEDAQQEFTLGGIEAAERMAELRKEFGDAATTLDQNTKAGIENQNMLQGRVEAGAAVISRMIEEGHASEDVATARYLLADAVATEAEKLGFGATKAAELRDQILNIPTNHVAKVTVEIDTAAVQAEIARLRGLGDLAAASAVARTLVTGQAGSVNRVGARATGGWVAPGQDYLVGERGPEVVRMQGRGFVYPANSPVTQGLVGRAGGGVVSGDSTTLSIGDLGAKANTEAAAAAKKHAEELKKLNEEIAKNKQAWDLEHQSLQERIVSIDRLIAKERPFTDEWVRLAKEREEATRKIAEEEKKAAEDVAKYLQSIWDDERRVEALRYEFGETSADQYIAQLRRRMEGLDQYSKEGADIWRELTRVAESESDRQADAAKKALEAQKDALSELNDLLSDEAQIRRAFADNARDHHDRMRELERQYSADQKQILTSRQDDLLSWASVTERATFTAAASIGALSRNITSQMGSFTEWQNELTAAKARGVSAGVIELLGLDQGPQALKQLRMFGRATDAQITELNRLVAQRAKQGADQVGREQADSTSKISDQLKDIADKHAAEVEEMAEEFLKKQRELSEELEELGKEQGENYGSALEAGLNSKVAGVRAAAERLRKAMSGGGKDDGGDFHKFYTGQSADTQKYLWEVGHPGGEPWPGYESYAVGTPYVPRTGLANLHQGERVLSAPHNRQLIDAVRSMSQPVLQVRADIYLDGKRLVDDRVRVVLTDMNTRRAISGAH